MKTTLFYISLVSMLFWGTATAIVAQDYNTTYTDYLPKYRNTSTHFVLSSITYTENYMTVHLRYIAPKEHDIITFYGPQNNNAWKLTTATYPRVTEQALTFSGTVSNIRLNDEAKQTIMVASEQIEVTANRGDIISCDIQFKRFPRMVRTVHLKGGDVNHLAEPKFLANDILIKSIDSKILGSQKQMEQNIQRFYSTQTIVNYPDIKTITTAAEQKKFDTNLAETKATKRDNPLQRALEPIDYMPKTLSSVDDLDCNERIILKNVYFHDNKAEFAGRVKALKTLSVVLEYLSYHKKAKIVLHGHTDIYGNAYKNLELSKQRVLVVKSTLVKRGVDRSRIITAHHGGSQPLPRYKNGGDMNRRVEVEVLCSGVVGNIKIPTNISTTSTD